MIKEFEYKGKWWLPDKPEEQISGTLKYSPVNGAILDLIESFKKNRDRNLLLQPDIILGNSSDDEEITLHKCFETSFNISSRGFTSSSFYANIVIIGQHFPKPKDIKFRNLSVNYQYFEEWSKIGVFSYHRNPGETFKKYEVKYEAPEPVEAKIDNFKISFAHNFNVSGDWLREVNLKRTTFIKIEPEHELHFEEYQNILYHLQNFLSLATMRAIYPLSIKATTEQNKIISPFSNGKLHYPSIDIFYNVMGKEDLSKKLTHYDMLFTFEDISGQFETYIQNWFGKADKLKPVYDLFFGTLYNPSMYLEQKFLSLVQAIETYHRRTMKNFELPEEKHEKRIKEILDTAPEMYKNWLRWKLKYTNEPPLKQRIKDILEAYSEVLDGFISDKKSFVDKTVDTRNYLTHYPLMHLFSMDIKLEEDLNKGILPKEIKRGLEIKDFFLSDNATVMKEKEDKWWITDEKMKKFIVRKEDEKLKIYKLKEQPIKEEELYPLTQKLKIILEVCLLRELDFSLDTIKSSILRNRRFQYG